MHGIGQEPEIQWANQTTTLWKVCKLFCGPGGTTAGSVLGPESANWWCLCYQVTKTDRWNKTQSVLGFFFVGWLNVVTSFYISVLLKIHNHNIFLWCLICQSMNILVYFPYSYLDFKMNCSRFHGLMYKTVQRDTESKYALMVWKNVQFVMYMFLFLSPLGVETIMTENHVFFPGRV